MEEYINKIDLQSISMQTLAFIGDSVYNVYVRTYLASISNSQTGILHKNSIKFVSAKGQAITLERIFDRLSEEEKLIYKRGRNTNVHTISKNVDLIEYKKATGFEALIGYLYLSKQNKRLDEIVRISIEEF